jgi:hypothetical protein
LRLYANYLSKFQTQAYSGQPVINYAGRNVVGSNPVAYPRWRGCAPDPRPAAPA